MRIRLGVIFEDALFKSAESYSARILSNYRSCLFSDLLTSEFGHIWRTSLFNRRAGDMNQLSTKRRAQIVRCLVEGNSVRATCRMTELGIRVDCRPSPNVSVAELSVKLYRNVLRLGVDETPDLSPLKESQTGRTP